MGVNNNTVLSPINGHSKRQTTLISWRFYFPLRNSVQTLIKNFLKSVEVISGHSFQRALLSAQTGLFTEAVAERCSAEKVFLEVLQNSQENTCARVSFLINACNFFKKETLTQVFSCEFCEISKNTFSHRTPPVAASAILQQKLCIKISSDKCICCFYWLFKTLAVNLCCILNNSQQK